MTLTQLNAFVLVARLGSVRAAARALGVSEPAVSQAINALRQHLGDRLLERGPGGMTVTPGGTRLLTVATQMVALGAEAEAAVRDAHGGAEQLRLVSPSTITEFVATPLLDAFARRYGTRIEASSGVANGEEMGVLVANRLADLALGPYLGAAPGPSLVSEPVFRCRMVVVGPGHGSRPPRQHRGPWLVDPSGADQNSDTGRLLARLGVPEDRIRVYPNQTAAWAAAADGAGLSTAPSHLIGHRVRRGELSIVETPATPMEVRWHATTLDRDARPPAAAALRRFLNTPEATHLMRAPGAGVPPSHFRPPVYVTIWR